jgi:tripeptidyl-peptidase-2
VSFEVRIRLESDVDFVQVPDQFLCAAKQRGFKVTVDPTGLAPGLHCGSVRGYDADAPGKGFLFSLPVTITKPVRGPYWSPARTCTRLCCSYHLSANLTSL